MLSYIMGSFAGGFAELIKGSMWVGRFNMSREDVSNPGRDSSVAKKLSTSSAKHLSEGESDKESEQGS